VPVDPAIARQIAATKAFDNHAHPVLPPPSGAPNDNPDRNFDALPVDNMEPQTDPVAWRPDNPQLPAAWKALWGFTATTLPLDATASRQLAEARARVKTREGARYDTWLLDRSGIGTQLANRVTMGPGVAPPRFLWVPYADALLFPLDNSVLAEATPDRHQFFPLEDRVRALDLHDSGLSAPPPTLAEYLAKVVTPTLERQRAAGAVAEKFEIAYLRPFGFTDAPRAEADRIYAQWIGKPRPDSADYKLLQDFLFRYIAQECGRLNMPVHLHTMSGGGGYFGIAGANPLLLEPLFNDPSLRKTRFVLLHGGWPFVHEIGALLQKPNVYLDLSQQALTFPPRTLATWLREWLELFPEKVLFGTDGYPYSDVLGWEESTWIAARNAREALALALTGMLQDHEIDRPRAAKIATGVLRQNALALYPQP
jgi:predicted TIM-barrel fold metal-dependent hydrolase